MINKERYLQLAAELKSKNTLLVAVSKIKPAKVINDLYQLGQKDFGENYVQELVDKQSVLPKDIQWHFIGHLQTNKVKYIAPFVHLIHGVDSLKLIKEINKQGEKNNRVIKILLQMHIAEEETKFGLNETELDEIVTAVSNEANSFKNVLIAGLMGMASFSENTSQVRKEFHYLKSVFNRLSTIKASSYKMEILSMGMSGDYEIAIEEGSNLVRIGSLIFGKRE
jgi:pyridoxal phosphate enzyme (YggS family)